MRQSSGKAERERATPGAEAAGRQMAPALTGALYKASGSRCNRQSQPKCRWQPAAATHHRYRGPLQPSHAQSGEGMSLQADESPQAAAAAAAADAAAPAGASPPATTAAQPWTQQQRLAEVLRFCLPVVLVPLVSLGTAISGWYHPHRNGCVAALGWFMCVNCAHPAGRPYHEPD